jgi:hypothetical protein
MVQTKHSGKMESANSLPYTADKDSMVAMADMPLYLSIHLYIHTYSL